MPQGETRRYVLTAPAFDGTRRMPAGMIVEVTPDQVGRHHAKLADEKYPKEHTKAFDEMQASRAFPKVEETISLAQHTNAIETLSKQLQEMTERLARAEAGSASARPKKDD